MDRRAFLSTAFGAPAVYGLARAFDDSGAAGFRLGGDDTLKAAFADMAKTRRGAVVIVVPTDEKQRRLLGEACHDLCLGTPFYDFRKPPAKDWEAFHEQWRTQTRQLFSATVLICLDEKTAVRRFKNDEGTLGGNRLLLDHNGAVVARQSRPGTVAGAFVPELLEFVKGKELAHLRSLAAAARASLDAHSRAELSVRFAALGDSAQPLAHVIRSAEIIGDHAERIGSMLLLGRLEARSANGRKHLQKIIDDKAKVPTSTALPYGTVMPRFDSCGCGTFRELKAGEEPDRGGLRIACGMAMPRPGSRRFLRFAR